MAYRLSKARHPLLYMTKLLYNVCFIERTISLKKWRSITKAMIKFKNRTIQFLKRKLNIANFYTLILLTAKWYFLFTCNNKGLR